MTYEELLLTPEYWITKIQIDLFSKVEQYMKENNLTRAGFAKKLGVSKGYITQVLNGDFDHRLSKLVELAIAIGYYPNFEFMPMSKSETSDRDRIASNIQTPAPTRILSRGNKTIKPRNTNRAGAGAR